LLGRKHGRAVSQELEDFSCLYRQWAIAEQGGKIPPVSQLSLELCADWLKRNPQLRYGVIAQYVAWYSMVSAGNAVQLSPAMKQDMTRVLDPKKPTRGQAIGVRPDLATVDLAALLAGMPDPTRQAAADLAAVTGHPPAPIVYLSEQQATTVIAACPHGKGLAYCPQCDDSAPVVGTNIERMPAQLDDNPQAALCVEPPKAKAPRLTPEQRAELKAKLDAARQT
jgi:hypothetical protein